MRVCVLCLQHSFNICLGPEGGYRETERLRARDRDCDCRLLSSCQAIQFNLVSHAFVWLPPPQHSLCTPPLSLFILFIFNSLKCRIN